MPIWALYLITIAIWGSSWYGIKEQLGVVAPTVSIAYRFLLAAAILWVFCLATRRRVTFVPRAHIWMALQGLCLFCGNYILFYYAGMHLVSGLLAVCFSTMSLMNVVNVWVFFRRPLDRNAGLAALVGLAGIALVFYPKFMEQNARADALVGLGLSMLATFLASLGNMISVKLKSLEIPVVQSNAIGMTYGAAFCALFSVVNGAPFNYDFRPGFTVSLVALAIFASVIGFGAYLTLVQKIGASRAGYTSVIFPIIALLLSTALEGYRWTPLAGLGLVLVLSGNLILLLKRKPQGEPGAPAAAPQFQKGPTG
jgi:drug/metabolite transporter (DMT)-like permease